ncbi:MAG: LytTR family DNA-binding domain-containing protein [Verrucomicrobiae bacterium]|nr:LytTR family DNA-binding domain-containing protein [Verrucomicrobiae bacterium]
MPRKLKALLVDDERLAHKVLHTYLDQIPEIEVVGEALSIAQAVEMIAETKPDIIFLDVQLGDGLGFDLLPKIEAGPAIIFVTAYQEYAIRAFEINALDYLTKPINPDRLKASIQRVVRASGPEEKKSKPGQFLISDQILLKIGNRDRFIKILDITIIIANADYSEVFWAGGNKGLVLRSMKEWEDILPASDFLRVHRSSIVNMHNVLEIKPLKGQEAVLVIDGFPAEIKVSRRVLPKLRGSLKSRPS